MHGNIANIIHNNYYVLVDIIVYIDCYDQQLQLTINYNDAMGIEKPGNITFIL